MKKEKRGQLENWEKQVKVEVQGYSQPPITLSSQKKGMVLKGKK